MLETQLSYKCLMDKLQDYEQLKEESEHLDKENDKQAKNYVDIKKGCPKWLSCMDW